MKKTRKLFSALLAVILAAAMLPVTVLAADEIHDVDDAAAFEEALRTVESGDTIRLTADIRDVKNFTVPAGTLTIDLNGKKLSDKERNYLEHGESRDYRQFILVPDGAVLHIKGDGELQCDLYDRSCGIQVDAGGSFILEGGTVKTIDWAENTLISAEGAVTMTGGKLIYNETEFESSGKAISSYGDLSISDGTIEGNTENHLVYWNSESGTFKITGGTFVNHGEGARILSENYDGRYTGKISGGVFTPFPVGNGGHDEWNVIQEGTPGAVIKANGTTRYAIGTKDIDHEVTELKDGDTLSFPQKGMDLSNVPDGVEVKNESGETIIINGKSIADKGTYYVDPSSGGSENVCRIGRASYPTLQAALAAAESGDTVQLTADIFNAENFAAVLVGTLTIDLNGHTLSDRDFDYEGTG